MSEVTWRNIVNSEDLFALRVCAIIQMALAGVGALSFLCGRICPKTPQNAETGQKDEGAEVDVPETDGENDKAFKSFSFSSLLNLIAAICGIVSLYTNGVDAEGQIHLFRSFQTFIALDLIGLIPLIGIAVLGTCAFIGSCLCACCKSDSVKGFCGFGAMGVCVFLVIIIGVGMAAALNTVILVFGWKYAFGENQFI